jgi:hypothetical protein
LTAGFVPHEWSGPFIVSTTFETKLFIFPIMVSLPPLSEVDVINSGRKGI